MLLASIVTVIAVAIAGGEVEDQPVYSIFFGTLAFQVLQAAYPWAVSKRKGLGLKRDWGFTAKLPADMGYGVLLAVGCAVGAYVATTIAAAIVGLENSEDASNTAIVTDNQDSPWLIGLIVLIVVGAPLAEELLFRGVLLRTIQKSFGTTAGIFGSSLLFMLPHIQADATWQETVVLWSALATVGVVLAIGAVKLGRIGPTIIAHLMFNSMGVLTALAATA